MTNKTLIFCTDIERPFIYGTLFEVLYTFEQKGIESTVVFIVGDRQIARLSTIKQLINEKFPLVNYIVERKGTAEFSQKALKQVADFCDSSLASLRNINDLKKLCYGDFQVGIPVASSFISRLTCPEPDIHPNRELIYWYLYYSIITFIQGRNIIESENPDTIYVYNGRFYNTYPLTLFSDKVKTVYYERIDQRRRLRIQEHRIHDCVGNSKLALQHYKSFDEQVAKTIGEGFFSTQKHVFFDKDRESFVVPEKKKIITYITTSDDEFESLHPDIAAHTLFPSQKSAAAHLINWVSMRNDYLLVIRAHPNIKNKSEKQQDYWDHLSGPNVMIIGHDSTIDTYDLIKKSDLVVGYRSTTLLEATFMGKPSILVSIANYTGHDVCYEPENHDQLNKLLSNIPAPKAAENALIWAFFMRNYGPGFKFLHSQGHQSFDELEASLFGH